MPDLVVNSAEWWVERLWQRLRERARRIQVYEDYYNGKQDLRFTTVKAREVFGDQFKGFADNFCALVVDAVDERLHVRGFRVGQEQDTDTTAADIWAANDMDAQAQLAHVEALVNEEAYAIVWADVEDRTAPVISVESPFEVICAYDTLYRRRREAALKVWWASETKRWYAVLYLPEMVVKYVSAKEHVDGDARASDKTGFWEPWVIEGEAWPLPNPLKVVPVVPLVNMPRLSPGQRGTSEIAAVIPLQDALNKTVFDQLIAQEFVAYPQRYMIGVSMPSDSEGDAEPPFKAGVDRLWIIETEEGATINPVLGQFPSADLRPYVDAVDQFVAHIAAITKTPKHYLVDPGGGTNLSGETIKALEAGLVSKARRKQRIFGESWEEVMGIALRVKEGGAVTALDMLRVEVEWFDPETRTESQHVDALVKLGSAPISVPKEQLWRDAGYTEAQIERFKAQEATAPAAPTPPSTTPPPLVALPGAAAAAAITS